MLHELGLLASFAICLWILIDLLGARGPWLRRLPLMHLSVMSAVWVVGELMMGRATDPEGVLLARRIIHFGIIGVPIGWLWTAAVISKTDWFPRYDWALAVAALPLLGAYSFLYWDESGLFLELTTLPAQRGPVFYAYTAYIWLLVGLGAGYYLHAARRLGRRRPMRVALLVACIALLYVGNGLYLTIGDDWQDPTPILLGIAGVAIRLTLIEAGYAGLLPMSHRRVVEQLRTGVVVCGHDGVAIDANPAANDLLGVADVAGQYLPALLHEARIDSARVLEAEHVVLHSRTGDVGTVTLLTDRTEAVRMEQQLLEAQKLESLGILAGGVAHDFNNLLTGIQMNADKAAHALEGPHPARTAVEEVQRGARLAAGLTGQLLAYAGRGQLDVRPLQLVRELQDVWPLLRSSIADRIELVSDVPEDLPAVEADPVEVRQVVINLVLNAAEAIGEGAGRIEVRCARRELEAEDLTKVTPGHALLPGEHVMICVSDSGPGMDEETRLRVFDPFFTTKPKGHGLGLAATLGIVHGHRGGIAVESRPDAGTSFRVYLPVSDKEMAPVADDEDTRGEATVLIVDDEDYVVDAAYWALERLGYEVLKAHTGEQAVERFRARSRDVELVLLDLRMPDMNGLETLDRLRAVRPDVRVILTSGYDESEVHRRYATDGRVGFLRKPWDPATLASRVRQALA